MVFDKATDEIAKCNPEVNNAFGRLAPDLQKGRAAPLEPPAASTAGLPDLRLTENGKDITNNCQAANLEQSESRSGSSDKTIPDTVTPKPAENNSGTSKSAETTDNVTPKPAETADNVTPIPAETRDKVTPKHEGDSTTPAPGTNVATSDSHGEVGAVSPEEAKKRGLPEHVRQTDDDFGTEENPVNNNCQTSTLKNVLNYYGQSDKAPDINKMEEQLLDAIKTKNGAGIDKEAFGKVSSGFEPPGSPSLMKSLNEGQTEPGFVQDHKITVDGKDVEGKVVTEGSKVLMLTELGTNPEKVEFGQGSNQKIMDALKDGKPVIISDNNTPSLRYMANGVDQKDPGHTYMIFQKDGKNYCSDSASETLFEVSNEVLNKKLNDSSSYGIILNSKPDTEHFLKH